MIGTEKQGKETDFHKQELRIALVMNGGVSLAVWIGGVAREINRLVRGEGLYGHLCRTLAISPRVDIISGTSAGGINGALLALAMSQGKSLEALREIWAEEGDILRLLRHSTENDPPSLLDGDYFYKAMVKGFQKIRDQQGAGLLPPDQVPIDLTLTTTLLCGEVNSFPDDVGAVIRDVTHRGQIRFRRDGDPSDDPFSKQDITEKLAVAARATASFPGAFQPFYLPGVNEVVKVSGESVPCLIGHTNFNEHWEKGRFVVDGGVLDNIPLESAIEAVFSQRAEGEVRRVLAYVVPDPGNIPDPSPQEPDKIPSLLNTTLSSLISIPRVESISGQLRAIEAHNNRVARQRDTRLIISRALSRSEADEVANAVFPSYRLLRSGGSAEYIADSLAEGAARYGDATELGDTFLGRRARGRIADILREMHDVPWVPQDFSVFAQIEEWRWGLFTLENIMAVVLDMLHRGVQLVPVRRNQSTESLWLELKEMQNKAFDVVAEMAELRRLDHGYWLERGKELAPELAKMELREGFDSQRLRETLTTEIRNWVSMLDPTFAKSDSIRPPRKFTVLAEMIGDLFLTSINVLQQVINLRVSTRWLGKHSELWTLLNFFKPEDTNKPRQVILQRLLVMDIVQYAFGIEATREQYLELIQFSANVPTAFDGPNRLEQKLAGIQVAHFGAFYKQSWRINDWMFGRLDGADRIMRILLDPKRLARLYGNIQGSTEAPNSRSGARTVVNLLHGILFKELESENDKAFLQIRWDNRRESMLEELRYLDSDDGIPDQLSQCAAMMLERLHLNILRRELPVLADAVGDDELDGADQRGNGPKFLKRFRSALCIDSRVPPGKLTEYPQLPAEKLIQLFKGAKVGEEKILEEVGTDRFTVTAARSAAVTVSALAGKNSGLKWWLRSIFAIVRTPMVILDILVSALLKKGKVFVSLFAIAMAVAATILLSAPLADAEWSNAVIWTAGIILAVGFGLLLRSYRILLFLYAVIIILALILWKGLPWIRTIFGS